MNVIEELAVDSGFGPSVAARQPALQRTHLPGRSEEQKKWLPKLTSGEWIGAWGLTDGRGVMPRSPHDRAGKTAMTGC